MDGELWSVRLPGKLTAGKYVGNRPIRLTKIKEDKYGTIETTALSNRKVSS